jgi:hypothetical protein
VVCLRAGLEARQRRLEVAPLADEAIALARAIEDPWTIAMAIRARALATDTAAELLERVEEAVSALQQVGNVYHQALMLHSAGEWALSCGRDHDARRYLDRAIPLTRALDQPYAWMLLLGPLGGAALLTGDTEAARDAFREQLALCRELGVPPVAPECLLGLAAVAAVDEDLDRAARLAGAAASHRFGEPERPVDERLSARFLSPARARHGPDAWDAAARAGGALSLEEAFADAQRAATRRARSHHGSGSG